MGKKHRTLQNTKNGKSSESSANINLEELKKLSEDFSKHSLTVYSKIDLSTIVYPQANYEDELMIGELKIPDTAMAKCSNPDKDDGNQTSSKKKEVVSEKDIESFFENALNDPDISDEKLAILTFFRLNSFRRLTREEVSEFFNTYFKIKTFKIIKRKLKSLGIEKVLEFVIDLRHRYTPEGDIYYPEKSLLEKITVEIEAETEQQQVTESQLPAVVNHEEFSVINPSKSMTENAEENLVEASAQEKNISETIDEVAKTEQRVIEPIGLKKLLLNRKNARYYFLADDVFDFRLKEFTDLIEEIVSQGIQPVFCLFEEDLPKLDMKKEECFAAQHFLKLFALDDTGEYTCLFHGNRPTDENFINHCLNNKITVVSGDAVTLLNCRMNSVNVLVPNFSKIKTPNPFKGETVIGFDSCVAINLKNNEIDELVKDAKSILLSDIQLFEVCSNIYLLKLCAYYGEIKKAERISENADKNIVNFYKNNPVDMVYTLDAGFKVFARFAKVPCIFLKDYLKQPANVDFYDIIRKHKYSEPDIEASKVDKVFYDSHINYADGKLRMDVETREFVFVYKNDEFKKTDSLKYIELSVGDKIFISHKNKILITELIDLKKGVGKILFWGTEEEMFKEYPQYSAGLRKLKFKIGMAKKY